MIIQTSHLPSGEQAHPSGASSSSDSVLQQHALGHSQMIVESESLLSPSNADLNLSTIAISDSTNIPESFKQATLLLDGAKTSSIRPSSEAIPIMSAQIDQMRICSIVNEDTKSNTHKKMAIAMVLNDEKQTESIVPSLMCHKDDCPSAYAVRATMTPQRKFSRSRPLVQRTLNGKISRRRATPYHPRPSLNSPKALASISLPTGMSAQIILDYASDYAEEVNDSLLPHSGNHRSNIKYTIEERDFIRYLRNDLNPKEQQIRARRSALNEPPHSGDKNRSRKDKTGWKLILQEFCKRFAVSHEDGTTDLKQARFSVQSMNSIHYRDNFWNYIDPATPLPLRDASGHVIWFSDSIRSRNKKAGCEGLTLPYTLVDKHPERALNYSWVSEDHKQHASRNIAEGLPTLTHKRVLELSRLKIAEMQAGAANGCPDSI